MAVSKVEKTTGRKMPPNAGKGRKKGTPNKATAAFRETVTKILEDNSENIQRWLAEVAAEDPKAAIDLITKLAEYSTPKLARTEMKAEVETKQPLVIVVDDDTTH